MGSTKYKTFVLSTTWLLLVLAQECAAKVGFYPQNEYRYEYVGQVRTGLPNVGTDKTAVGIAASVLIQPSGSDLIVQLGDIRSFANTVDGHEETIDEIPLAYKSLQDQTDLKRPFKIIYQPNSDKFNGIEVTQDDPPSSVNIKKALAVFLNVRLDQQLSKRQGYFAAHSTSTFEPIDVVEPGIEGSCNTKYIYQQQPWPGNPNVHVLNVTKIRDAKSCEDKPIWRQSIQESQKCTSCESSHESFINHGSVAHYNAYEENGQYVLQSAENHGQTDVTPFPPHGDKLRITQFQKLKLVEIRRSSGRTQIPGRVIQEPSMTIVPEELNLKARYKRYTKASGQSKISPIKIKAPKDFYKQEDAKTRAQQLLDQLVTKFQNIHSSDASSDALNQIPTIVSTTRLLTYDEIQELYQKIGNQEDKRKFFIDIVVMTGTDASTIFIKYLLEQGKLTGEHAAQVISSIPAYILEPKPAILEELWSLCKGRLMKENRQIYVTTMLAFGELVNQACVPKERAKTSKPYHVKVAGCPKALTTRYLQELMNLFEQSNEMWEKSSIMYTIYRMGLNDTLDYLIPYLQGKMFSLPVGLRTEILASLFEIGPGRQHEIAKYILPIFYNTSLSAEERIIAFEVISYTTTSQAIMNQLALSTWHEPDNNVAAYIYSYLNAVRNFTVPCWAQMAVRSQQAFLLVKPVEVGILDSKLNSYTSYAEKWGMGSSFSYGSIHSSKSLFPRISFIHFGKELAGYYYSPLEILTINDGMQNLMDYLIGPKADYSDKKFSDLFKYDSSPPETAGSRGQEDFVITPRKDEPFYTRIMFSYLQNRHRLFFLDQNTLKDIKNSGFLPQNKDLYSSLRDGIPINFRKFLLLEDTELRFSSMIGFPMRIEFKMPSYIDIRGKISLEASKAGMHNALSHVVIKPELDYAFSLNAWVGIYTDATLDNKVVAAQATGNLFSSMSLNGYINADFAQNSFTASLRKSNTVTSQKYKQTPLFTANIVPLLSVVDLATNARIEKIVNGTGVQRELDVVMDAVSGLPFGNSIIIKSTSDLPIKQEKQLWSDLKKEGLLHMLAFAWAPRHFNLKTIEVIRDPQYSDTEQVEMTINWKHSPSPFEEELWRGKSALQRLRLWNLLPEWKDAPVACKDVQTTARIQTTTEAPKKKSWFGRFKDKVKSTFGRSGGESEEDDDDDDDDDSAKKEDRGRALHPHITTGESDSSSGSRSPIVSGSSQSRSSGGSSYGQQGGGQDYSQTQYGAGQGHGESQQGGYGQTQYSSSSTGYGQTQHSSSSTGYGQTQYGSSSSGYGQTQHGSSSTGYGQTQSGSSDYDWEQKPSSVGQGFTGQHTNQGHGQYGGAGQQGGYDSDRLRGKKAAVRKIYFKDEVSTTLISFKLNALGTTKRQITADITLSSNAPQGNSKVSIIVDFLNVFKYPLKIPKMCFNGDYYSGFSQCPNKNQIYPSFDYKLQWGEACDNRNYVSMKGTFSTGPESPSLWVKYSGQCSNDIKIGFLKSKECLQSFEEATKLTKAKYEIHYSQPPSPFLINVNKAVDGYLKCHLSDFLLENNVAVNNAEGRITAELDYDLKTPTVDIKIAKPKEEFILKDVHYEKFGPFLQPKSSAVSYLLKLGNSWTKDKLITKCIIGQDGAITTFNTITYNYTLDGCQHILAKDCSQSNLFTVSASGSPNKKIKVQIFDHTIESSSIPTVETRVEFLVDGKSDFIQEGEMAVIRSQGNEDRFLAHISSSGAFVTIKSPPLGLIVTYSQHSVLVVVSEFWKGKVCGLCGEDTEDEHFTFLGPDQCLYNDPTAFARSYRVQGPQCPQIGYRGTKGAQCLPMAQESKSQRIREQLTPGDYQTTGGSGGRDAELVQTSSGHQTGYPSPPVGQTTGQTAQTDAEDYNFGTYKPGGKGSDDSSSSNCYTTRNLIKRRTESYRGKSERQVCFSSKAVRQCHASCLAVDFAPETVQFRCYLESSDQGRQLTTEVQKGVLSQTPTGSIATFEEDMMIAQQCTPKY